MATKAHLRIIRAGMVINATAKKQESDVMQALRMVIDHLLEKYGDDLNLAHAAQWKLADIVSRLKPNYLEIKFHYHFDSSFICPDGGILHIGDEKSPDIKFPILISEVKNQGTNDRRAKEGLKKQARGNAIERLGKNVIGLRAAMLNETIFPFVCFGYGCDFEDDSSILDRVTTIAMFGRLNETHLHNETTGPFNRGSFYFREKKWTVEEMTEVMKDIAERSVEYYFSKYGRDRFFTPS